jgi:hypothetical protein
MALEGSNVTAEGVDSVPPASAGPFTSAATPLPASVVARQKQGGCVDKPAIAQAEAG